MLDKCKIEIYSDHLKNKNIAVLVGDSINAYKVPEFIMELRKYSCEVYPYVTEEGLQYVTEDILKWASDHDVNKKGKDMDAVIVYPTTNTKVMFDNFKNVKLVDNILDNNIEIKSNVSKVVRELSESNLKGKNILVTAGPTPVKIDNVRRITNKFSGKLGIEIANELYLRGVNVTLFQSYSGIRPPEYINHILFDDYDEYKKLCVDHCNEFEYGIFSAAVADYKPKEVVAGKIPSGGLWKSIELVQTEKVIKLVKEMNPSLKMISFKYEEGKTLEELIEIANKRLHNGHLRVVANDLTLNDIEQKCFLCGLNENDQTIILNTSIGKINIARMIADDIEKIVKE